MICRRFCLPIIAGALAASGVQAHDHGRLGTLPPGRYLCELPGDAAGPASRPVPRAWFDILNATSYVTEGGRGTYLLRDKQAVFTRGPLRGARFDRTGERTLKRTDLTGELAKMRCVRTGAAR